MLMLNTPPIHHTRYHIRYPTMNPTTFIGKQSKVTHAYARHTLLLFLTDHLYTKAGYQEQIPDKARWSSDDNYTFIYHDIRSHTCILSAQLKHFNFDSWEVMHNDGDDNTGAFFQINLYRGNTSFTKFCEKRGYRLDLGSSSYHEYLPFVSGIDNLLKHTK